MKINTQYSYRKISACPFEKFLGVELGRGTVSQVEAVLGKGREIIGVHSNSGREWSFRKGTEIYVDGSRSQGRSYILDFVQLMGHEGLVSEGFPKRVRKYLEEIGKWRWGMSLTKLEQRLLKLGGSPRRIENEIHCQYVLKGNLEVEVSVGSSGRGFERIRLLANSQGQGK